MLVLEVELLDELFVEVFKSISISLSAKTAIFNEHIIEKLKKLPNIGDTVYGIFRQTKIIPLTITGITFNDFGITLSAKNEEELGYSTINLLTDNTGMEWYKTYEEAEKSVKEILASRSLSKNKDVERI